MTMIRSVLLALVAPVAARNGYALACQGADFDFATTRVPLLDPSNPEIARLSNGLTISTWLRFDDRTPAGSTWTNYPFALANADDLHFITVFAGSDGYLFGQAAPPTYSLLGDGVREWHHFAMTYEPHGGAVNGTVRMYIDGVLRSTNYYATRSVWPADREPFLYLCSATLNTHASVIQPSEPINLQWSHWPHALTGHLDDFALFAAALTPEQIAERWNASLTDRIGSGLEPDLIVFYNFNDPLSEPGVARNSGTAGADYDLLLGRVASKPPPYDTEFLIRTGECADEYETMGSPVFAPAVDSRTWPVPKATDASAPLVLVAAAGATLDLSAYGLPGTLTVPSAAPAGCTLTANCTYVASAGGQVVHVLPLQVPLRPPKSEPPSEFSRTFVSVLEDFDVALTLWGRSALGLNMSAVITSVPTGGTVYRSSCTEVGGCEPVGLGGRVRTTQLTKGANVLYKPFPDDTSTDTFTYVLQLDDFPEYTSGNVSVVIEKRELNDIPLVNATPTKLSVHEDAPATKVPLFSVDAEDDTALDFFVSTLPKKGTLYSEGPGNTLMEIEEAFSAYIVGETVSQYLDSVRAVSSFWGNPPYSGYHALNILGPPDCDAYGECSSTGPWVTAALAWAAGGGVGAPSVFPPVGTRVLVNPPSGLTATIHAVDTAAGNVTVKLHPMYKLNGSGVPQPCFIDAYSASRLYPSDCAFASSDVMLVTLPYVPGVTITGVEAGVWCPLDGSFVGDRPRFPEELNKYAFGAEYVFYDNQAWHYPIPEPGYTEYIEVRVAEPVYLLDIEIGSPRGMGMVVAIKALDPDGDWVVVYHGDVLKDEQSKYTSAMLYWTWRPDICKPHFLVDTLRIETDTSVATGVGDWSYIDYVLVTGSRTLQAAAVPHGAGDLWYAPAPDATGADSFTYQATDCSSDPSRSSAVASVSVLIGSSNDAPEATNVSLAVPLGSTDVPVDLQLVDVDDPAAVLRPVITSLPSVGTLHLRYGNGSSGPLILSVPMALGAGVSNLTYKPPADPATLPPELNVSTAVATGAPLLQAQLGFEYEVSDPHNRTTTLSLQLVYELCAPGHGVKITNGQVECGQCSPGTSAVTSRAACAPCAPGTFEAGFGSSACTACSSHFHQPQSGQIACAECAPRTGALDGAPSCDSCAEGYYLAIDATEASEAACLECPRGADCPLNSSVASLVLQNNYWRLSLLTVDIHRCPLEGGYSSSACAGGGSIPGARRRLEENDLVTGSLYCREASMRGPRCEVCSAAGQYFDGGEALDDASQRCVDCPSPGKTAGVAIAIALAVGVPLTLLYYLWVRVIREGKAPPRLSKLVSAKILSSKMLPSKALAASGLRDAEGNVQRLNPLSRAVRWLLQARQPAERSGETPEIVKLLRRHATQLSLMAKFKLVLNFYQVIAVLISPAVYGVRPPHEFSGWVAAVESAFLSVPHFILPRECLGNARERLIINALWPVAAAALLLLVLAGRDAATTALRQRAWRARCFVPALRQGLWSAIFISYCTLPSVSRAVFESWTCESYGYDDRTGATRAFMRTDGAVECQQQEHAQLIELSWAFLVLWPVLLPLAYLALLWRGRHQHAKVDSFLASATHFLWKDYRPSFYWWEPVAVYQRLVLTSFILFLDPEGGAEKLARLIVGALLCAAFLALTMIARPYQQPLDNALASGAQLLLLCSFIGGIAVKLCREDALVGYDCWSLVGFGSEYEVALVIVLFSVMMLVAMVGAVWWQLRALARSRPTLRLRASGLEPRLSLPENKRFHTFISHAWSTGQDQAATLKVKLQRLVPGISCWLDVDQLDDLRELEQSVQSSLTVLVFLSRGYFASANCRRELYAALESRSPLILVHETNEAKGGAPLADLEQECADYCTEKVYITPESNKSRGSDGGGASAPDTAEARSTAERFRRALTTAKLPTDKSNGGGEKINGVRVSSRVSLATVANSLKPRSSLKNLSEPRSSLKNSLTPRRLASEPPLSPVFSEAAASPGPLAGLGREGSVEDECDLGEDVRAAVFGASQPICWVRAKEYQLVSLKLIVMAILRQTPYYKVGSGSRSRHRALELSSGCCVRGEPKPLIFRQPVRLLVCPGNDGAGELAAELEYNARALQPSVAFEVVDTLPATRDRSRESVASRVTRRLLDVPALAVEGAARLSQGIAEESLGSGTSGSRRSGWRRSKRRSSAVRGLSLDVARQSHQRDGNAEASGASGDETLPPTHMLLYLNARTFTDDGVTGRSVFQAMQQRVSIVLVQEMDPEKGACAFRRFLETTPPALIKGVPVDGVDLPVKLFDTLAVPLFTSEEHRAVSMIHIAQLMGGTAVRGALAKFLLKHPITSRLSPVGSTGRGSLWTTPRPSAFTRQPSDRSELGSQKEVAKTPFTRLQSAKRWLLPPSPATSGKVGKGKVRTGERSRGTGDRRTSGGPLLQVGQCVSSGLDSSFQSEVGTELAIVEDESAV